MTLSKIPNRNSVQILLIQKCSRVALKVDSSPISMNSDYSPQCSLYQSPLTSKKTVEETKAFSSTQIHPGNTG